MLGRLQAGEHGTEALGRIGVVVAVGGGKHVLAVLLALTESIASGEQDVSEDVAGTPIPQAYQAALAHQQVEHMERSIKYARDVLGLGKR